MVKNLPANAGDVGSIPGLIRKILWTKKCQSSLVFLLSKSRVQSILVGYSPHGHKESDMTEQLSNNNNMAYLETFKWALRLTFLSIFYICELTTTLLLAGRTCLENILNGIFKIFTKLAQYYGKLISNIEVNITNIFW